MKVFGYLWIMTMLMYGCNSVKNAEKSMTKLIVIDPQHFHAALVQKVKNPQLDSQVSLFADQESTVSGYLSLINQYNSRSEAKTDWTITPYYGNDFLSKAFEKNDGDVVVLAGDNEQKINYILESVKHKKNVFADKPLVINNEGFEKLKEVLENNGGPIIYDIMTERYDVKNIIIKDLLNNQEFSGGFNKQSQIPLVELNSVHHFIKTVSGKPLVRPSMFFDVSKQGEGLVDVTTHYIDLVQWVLSPEKPIEIDKDLLLKQSERWSTVLSKQDFQEATALQQIPKTFELFTNSKGEIEVFSNGKMEYSLLGVPVQLAVQWNVRSTNGKGDQFAAVFKAEKISIEIKPDLKGKQSVFIQPADSSINFEFSLDKALKSIHDYQGISYVKESGAYKLLIPETYNLSHEEHFAKVLQQFLQYKEQGKIPSWETSFLLAKYYLTTEALKTAKTKK